MLIRLNALTMGQGYASMCGGRENPDMEGRAFESPIPRGAYDIGNHSLLILQVDLYTAKLEDPVRKLPIFGPPLFLEAQ